MTIRTALSFTSGEYRTDILPVVFIALSSQEIESPTNPGRFKLPYLGVISECCNQIGDSIPEYQTQRADRILLGCPYSTPEITPLKLSVMEQGVIDDPQYILIHLGLNQPLVTWHHPYLLGPVG